MLPTSRLLSRRLWKVAALPRRCYSSNQSAAPAKTRTPSKQSGDRAEPQSSRKVSPVPHLSVTSPSDPPTRKPRQLNSLWLRDHCHCSQCVNQDTMQRAYDTFSLPHDDPGEVLENGAALRVKWKDGHISEYSWDWLDRNASLDTRNAQLEPQPYTWDSEIKNHLPSVHYDEIMASDAGVAIWTSKILRYGFCYVDGCPVSPEKTKELLERIAYIRITHYGGFYDFTSDLTMKDTAYTSLALPPHTDNTYFTDPSRLQMFHLLSHTDGTGGASVLVDGLKCASLLYNASPSAYKILNNFSLRWHASGNEGVIISPTHRSTVLSRQRTSPFIQIRWNNDDRATITPRPGLSEWYEAARLFDSIIKDEHNQYWEQLQPGRPLIFDNWRVLHGRSAFTGKRRMSGGYINNDDFVSRFWTTNFPRQEVLENIL